MEIIYRAKDGKEFDNEPDCTNHELQLEVHKLEKTGGIIALDYYDRKISNYLKDFDNVYHIYFINEDAITELDIIFNQFRNEGLSIVNKDLDELFENGLPNAKTWYHWNDCEEQYESDEYKIRQLQDHIEEYDDILKKVREENGS